MFKDLEYQVIFHPFFENLNLFLFDKKYSISLYILECVLTSSKSSVSVLTAGLTQTHRPCGRMCCTWCTQLLSEGSINSWTLKGSNSTFSTKESRPSPSLSSSSSSSNLEWGMSYWEGCPIVRIK